MGARTSPAMLQAMILIRSGTVPLRAAKITGLRPHSVYSSRLYKAWVSEGKPINQGESA